MSLDLVQQNFADSLQYLHLQGVSPQNVVLAGSAVLYLIGLLKVREHLQGPIAGPSDLDLLITDSAAFNKLAAAHPVRESHLNGFHGRTVSLHIDDTHLPLDVTCRWPVEALPADMVKHGALPFEGGGYVMAPHHVVQSMGEFHREKDDARLKEIDPHALDL